MLLYSIRMRAAKGGAHEQGGTHISGAERIVTEDQLSAVSGAMMERALKHSKGRSDFINITVDEIPEGDIHYVPLLSIVEESVADEPRAGRDVARRRLLALGLGESAVTEAFRLLDTLPDRRGAILVDAQTGQRLDDKGDRGVRVSKMDYQDDKIDDWYAAKGYQSVHVREALALASKVLSCEDIVAELCWSDDPQYTTGYVSGRSDGRGIYYRTAQMKDMGSSRGGRVFFVRQGADLDKIIEYLENCPVLVETPAESTALSPEERPSLWAVYEDRLAEIKAKDRYRSTRAFLPDSATMVRKEGSNKPYLMMCSNSYLGLTHHPAVIAGAIEAAEAFGTGSGGARLTTGTFSLFHKLERELADFKGKEEAIVFNTGYMANLGTVSALVGPGDVVLSDEKNHASIIDGIRMSRAKCFIYKHCDTADLEAQLKKLSFRGRQVLIVTDGVFSMDGDIAPLDEIAFLARRYGALLMVDDAHGTGVLAGGRGTAAHFGVEDMVTVQLGTLSKALAAEGGFVATNAVIKDYLVNRSRPFIFSTALSPADIGAARVALHLVASDPSLVQGLHDNCRHFMESCKRLGVEAHSDTAIFPIIVGSASRALKLQKALEEEGIILSAIRYPTVPDGEARIRLTVTAAHTPAMLDRVAEALAKTLKAI